MSKTPSWMNSAQENKIGNTVGTPQSTNIHRNKPGPKEAKVERKSVGFKISNVRNGDIDKLEIALKSAGLPLTRGRSETVELAVSILLHLLSQPENKEQIVDLLSKNIANEDS